MSDDLARCAFVTSDPLYIAYHDTEWGVPVYDDRRLLEFLLLEGAQAGLSWLTILKRREAYRRHFESFDAERIAAFDEHRVARLLQEPSLIRNRRKIESAVNNARAFLEIQQSWGSFHAYLWNFVDGRPKIHHFQDPSAIPQQTDLSQTISRDLRARKFQFVGPTIVYAYLQATGVVMDHLTSCFRFHQLAAL